MLSIAKKSSLILQDLTLSIAKKSSSILQGVLEQVVLVVHHVHLPIYLAPPHICWLYCPAFMLLYHCRCPGSCRVCILTFKYYICVNCIYQHYLEHVIRPLYFCTIINIEDLIVDKSSLSNTISNILMSTTWNMLFGPYMFVPLYILRVL